MANFTKTEPYTFAALCDSFKMFKIPNFQRPYKWTNKNIQEFWSSIISNQSPYFIGNIVAVSDESLLVIDGQQRLTTINLLLIALRDTYSNIKVKKSDKTKVSRTIARIDKYLKDDDLSKSVESEYKRLELGKDMYQKIFNMLVDNEIDNIDIKKLTDNQKRLINNYEILKKFILSEIKGSELNSLDGILNKVLNLQFIVIVCATENDIYGIFEGFNSTGLGLSVADLVKNSILKGSARDTKMQSLIEELWNEMELMFDETIASKFPKFLRHQWISVYGHVSMSNLYREIKSEKIDNKTPQIIKEYVESVLFDAKIYLGMLYWKHEKNLDLPKDILEEIFKFRFLQNDQVYEVLLTYHRAFKEKRITQSFFKKFLKRLWIFTVRARFVSVNPSKYEKIFSTQCKEIYECKNIEEVSAETERFFSKLKKLVSSDEQFVENFIADVKYGKDNKLISLAISDLMSYDNPEISIKEPEIEHILPQEPKKWGFAKSEVKDYVDKIGNLTLLFSDFNKKNSNETMSFKKAIFKKSKLKFNVDIADKWGDIFVKDFKNAIERRSIDMTKRIEKIWK
ncbi:MAG TPA: hypothetical protein DEA43_00990 [Candidatus Moranbacteria bacterium]|nr:hypothetical protein [Candidatus Moranbacteria bacterium]HBT45445.1 hypothetical protein [Candidatus Moranbacteria bacterium]